MRILLFSDFSLPNSCAAATRVINLAKILKQSGHSLDLLGVSYDQEETLSGMSDGIFYQLLRAENYTGFQAYKRIRSVRKELAKYLKTQTEQTPYDCIILSNIYFDYSFLLMRHAAKKHTKLIANAVEWYDKNNKRFEGLTGIINFAKNRIALTFIHKKMKNILAISTLLDNYYKQRGCNTVIIPTIVDLKEYTSVTRTIISERSELHIAYAGTPGKKDFVLNAVHALPILSDNELKRVQFHFYGVSYWQLHQLGLPKSFMKTYKENLFCHGKIPYEQVKEKIADADFTILLRPNLRYANAGFPTKVGESMACGTPVIANLTSDLNKYIVDGQTGFVCADESPESCAVAIRKALQMTDAERETMRKETLQMAEKAFDYHVYSDSLEKFMTELL